MQIEHIAIWTNNLEKLKEFYVNYFDGQAGEKYYNPKKEFESYFIEFESGARLEIMRKAGIKDKVQKEVLGYAHLAFSVGSKEKVDQLTNNLEEAGYEVVGGPRRTGDGYYESSVLDPDGNKVEITE
ncbi:VOC family protein [Halanaerobacter jeridensis]|uniref:Lactoylglutathione lyase n=1 Tax=Halanaerobacter jeridensis TaxID=706427 RepID=A0A939BS53_9FIRM|nr:VOC family protein [Halanaerobacter jeridensis]MBM7556761.1 lactoylglutathione lyase [Halanaerobacter jeridensis]